ncbi:MAG: hypothetical protein KJO36_01945 [Acidimicrobiia bacterium]|nr:hypothetical protein [Acidimicrobiia bacterium]MBT8250636.1 hypothetical protein [Acidimicrobiia bacterium]NNL28800.1 hypothetical protein [Acidimicrobiia bacterium]
MDNRTRKALMRAGIHMGLALTEVLKAVQVILSELARPDTGSASTQPDRSIQRIVIDE